ncbi:hypothetical protein [Ktedonobacter racemifer]|uniref:Uncharacterized protein n=1 Tax=Ktedonobacter racemifer DSM 44963 TaxID=485913 RepID=D6TVY6_KTERA|nr:hypothetical protein [Ktedonobacter racemifer]EFH84369.1 hypothetical protein Krac_5400 [Ktedonobacter racemifer DSM 44963]
MQYGDPRDARRAARNARRSYRRNYRRSRGGWLGIVFIIIAVVYFTHHLSTILFGLGVLVLLLIGAGLFMSSRNRGMKYQQPYQTPAESEEQQSYYQPYDQGYQPPPANYQEGGQQYYYPSQNSTQPQPHEAPEAQYPEQLPPMQQ